MNKITDAEWSCLKRDIENAQSIGIRAGYVNGHPFFYDWNDKQHIFLENPNDNIWAFIHELDNMIENTENRDAVKIPEWKFKELLETCKAIDNCKYVEDSASYVDGLENELREIWTKHNSNDEDE